MCGNSCRVKICYFLHSKNDSTLKTHQECAATLQETNSGIQLKRQQICRQFYSSQQKQVFFFLFKLVTETAKQFKAMLWELLDV